MKASALFLGIMYFLSIPIASFYAVSFGWFVYTIVERDSIYSVRDLVSPSYYRVHSNMNLQDPVVKNITEYCSYFGPRNQASCVVTETASFYNYTSRENKYDIKSASDFKNTGGLCRDYAVMVDAIFRNLEWDTSFVFVPGHVYNSVAKSNIHCSVNGEDLHCWEME